MVYSNTCLLCKSSGKETKYIGETARTMLERNKEHQRDALASSKTLNTKTSHIRDHAIKEHPGDEEGFLGIFRMDMVKSSSSALERQVRKTVEIRRTYAPAYLLNLKEEYNRCLLPTMVMEGPRSVREQEDQDQEERALLTPGEEEAALKMARKNLKTKLKDYKETRGPPPKRFKHGATPSTPSAQTPPQCPPNHPTPSLFMV